MNLSTTREFRNDDQRWLAVRERNPTAAAHFIYAVKTTGIYCRPGCSSRRPRRENVVFFSSVRQAREAGFRACRRCRPDRPQTTDIPRQVTQACQWLDQTGASPSLEQLAAKVGWSPFHLHRQFRRFLGVTPLAYARSRRQERFRSTLQTSATVSEAVYAAGYRSSSTCYAEAKSHLGMTPDQFRHGAVGVDLRTATVPCRLGWLGIVLSPAGLCAIDLADQPESLLRVATAEYHRANWLKDDPEAKQMAQRIAEWLHRPATRLDLPLDLPGTEFQKSVWLAIRQIPPGETITYTELAERLGRPAAVRAVAHACACNRVALLIPCHRVLRKNGGLGGYRWGPERKQSLLKAEAESRSGPN